MTALVVYEYQHERHAPQLLRPRKQVISYEQSNLGLDAGLPISAYLIPLLLTGNGKTILGLWLSPYQVSRLAKYLRTKEWDGGFTMCPWNSWPQTTIHGISEMPELVGNPQENKRRTECGLFFALKDSDIVIEWIPDDREMVSKYLAELAKICYELRSKEPREQEPQIDIEGWKHHLFNV